MNYLSVLGGILVLICGAVLIVGFVYFPIFISNTYGFYPVGAIITTIQAILVLPIFILANHK